MLDIIYFIVFVFLFIYIIIWNIIRLFRIFKVYKFLRKHNSPQYYFRYYIYKYEYMKIPTKKEMESWIYLSEDRDSQSKIRDHQISS